ncbi:MAG: hypothetical protein UY76_C0064G0002 [Candidatus Uhrbacteria bacterium GW2011_GWA2_52_8d]|uniref:Uncharacterized protein n=1 Tax=Candidatus Uhrbacteria bacterium GW2011_GWA2_52_8d TaxID=1618979 RepID=A0A0G1XJ21_9BACT|nr:MAG: hypothetical protein UY76_C0064G0002 [Candidatus Uhrbacteria bacterium GW2011_GWA2_52_8d]
MKDSREQMDAYEELGKALARLKQRQSELVDAYRAHGKKGEDLRQRLVILTGAMRLIGEDVWALARLDPEIQRQFIPTQEVLPLLIDQAPAQELGRSWRRRYDDLQSHVLEPGVARGVRKRTAEAIPRQPVEVCFLPGSIFETDQERELQSLIAIFLLGAFTKGHQDPIMPDEIVRLLSRACLLPPSAADEQIRTVKAACRLLVDRGVVGKKQVQHRQLGRFVDGYVIKPNQARSYVDLALSQVSGGHGEVLREQIRRVIPDA